MKITTIVLAEDDAANQRLFKMVLEDCGYKVLTASNGREVLQHLDTAPDVDLVLMDVNMPGMDGIETVKHIRSSKKPYAGIHVVGVTAHAGLPERNHFIAAGMDEFAPKPVDLGQLIEIIDRLLAKGWRPHARSA